MNIDMEWMWKQSFYFFFLRKKWEGKVGCMFFGSNVFFFFFLRIQFFGYLLIYRDFVFVVVQSDFF